MDISKKVLENMDNLNVKNLLPNTQSLLNIVVSASKHQSNVRDIMKTYVLDCSLYEYIHKYPEKLFILVEKVALIPIYHSRVFENYFFLIKFARYICNL